MNSIRNSLQRTCQNSLSSAMKNLNTPNPSRYAEMNYVRGSLNRSIIQESLATQGYCLYRGTNLELDLFDEHKAMDTAEGLQKSLFGDNHELQTMDYSHGTDRRSVYNKVLLGVNDNISNTHYINFHNELAYTDSFPRVIAFVCIQPSLVDGCTPISNTRDALTVLPSELREKFERFGVRYIRNLRDSEVEKTISNNPLEAVFKGQKSWQDVFGTDDVAEMERLCKEVYNYDFEWVQCRSNQTRVLRISHLKHAVVYEKEADFSSFANSVLGSNGCEFDGYSAYFDSLPNIERPLHSTWGNGEEFSQEEISQIKKTFNECSLRFEWNAGDILILDNLWWAHGRHPYEGARKILALMGVPYVRAPSSDNHFLCAPVHPQIQL